MGGYECNNPGTIECFLLSILYALVLGPLEMLLQALGYDFSWSIDPA